MKATPCSQLGIEERNSIHRLLNEGCSLRQIARVVGRSPSTISREVVRAGAHRSYDGANAQVVALRRRRRGPRKLAAGTALLKLVKAWLRVGYSPQQIAGRLRRMYANQPEFHMSHETIHATPRGELRRESIGNLRKAHKERRPRGAGNDRRRKLQDIRSIHERPEKVFDRLVPGHWEGDLIKGAGNRSAVATLVERKTRFVVLAKMDACGAEAALEALTKTFHRVPLPLRKSLTYDQGKEMAHHAELSRRVRPSNENMNGLVQDYLPKGDDLSVFSQGHLNANFTFGAT
ncbi:IS30 family transposase [Cupriavidus pauculus]|nr:IS30 family transposase [Cupriavidus pauculus]